MDMLADADSNRLTGTHAEFTEEQARSWYGSRGEQDDRLDLAIVERASGEYAGEVVLNDLDRDNRSIGFRIGLRSGVPGPRPWLGGDAAHRRLRVRDARRPPHRARGLRLQPARPARLRACRLRPRGHEARRPAWDGEWVDAELMSILSTDPATRPLSRTVGGRCREVLGAASAGGLAVGPHVDRRRLDAERREPRADLAAVVRPVLDGLGEPEPERRVEAPAVALLDDVPLGVGPRRR